MKLTTHLGYASAFLQLQTLALELPSGPLQYNGLKLRKTGMTESNVVLFNNIHHAIDLNIQEQTQNYLTGEHKSEPEKFLVTTEPLLFGYDLRVIGRQLLRQMIQSQHEPPAAPPAPFEAFPPYPTNSESSIINFAWAHYITYGDIGVLEESYQSLTKLLDHASSLAQSHILVDSLGDWGANDTSTPPSLVGTAKWAQGVQTMIKIASEFKHTSDVQKYEALNSTIIKAFNDNFRNQTFAQVSYGSGSQTSNALAFDIGAVNASDEDAVYRSLFGASIGENGYYQTFGAVGLPAAYRVYSKDYANMYLINELMLKTDSPATYGYHIESNTSDSAMSDYGDTWIYGLAGMRQAPDSVAWKKILYEPVCVQNLSRASTEYMSVQGLAAASWERKEVNFEYNATVPANSVGEITIQAPFNNITINGQLYQNQTLAGVQKVEQVGSKTTTYVGPGTYAITAKNSEMYFCGQT